MRVLLVTEEVGGEPNQLAILYEHGKLCQPVAVIPNDAEIRFLASDLLGCARLSEKDAVKIREMFPQKE